MSMHRIRGVQVHGRSKMKRKAGWKKAQDEHEAFLKKMGVTGKKSTWRSEIPEYKCKETVPTSDVICSNGSKKEAQKYTGDLIKGIATMHKSNAVPVTNDRDAKAIARMRR